MSTGRAMTTAAPTKTHIRWMIRRDMPDVLRTERDSFEYSWTEEDFLKCLRQRNCIGMVAEAEDRVVGFMIYELHKNKLNVLNFAVAPHYRRQGIGTQMISKLSAKLTTHRRSKVTLAVRESNLSAQLFFRNQEFKAVKVLKKFYEDSGEDAFQMEYRVGSEYDDDLDRPVNRIARFEKS